MLKVSDQELEESGFNFTFPDSKLLSSVNYDLRKLRNSGSNSVQVGGTTVTLSSS